jgi:hypothetical protein
MFYMGDASESAVCLVQIALLIPNELYLKESRFARRLIKIIRVSYLEAVKKIHKYIRFPIIQPKWGIEQAG